MRQLVLSTASLLTLVGSRPCIAAGGVATDQNVSLVYATSHWDGSPAANLVGAAPPSAPLAESGWWYRASGDPHEYPFPPPDTESYSFGVIVANWYDLDGKGYFVQEATHVFDTEGPSGGFVSRLYVSNMDGAARSFSAFHSVALTLNGTFGDDSGVLLAPKQIKFTDGPRTALYRSYDAAAFEVKAYSDLRSELNDSAYTTLDDTGLPFGPGAVTAAFQSTKVIGANTAMEFGPVSLFFDLPSDHVKGDPTGVFPFPMLLGQDGSLQTSAQKMRRTDQIGYWFDLTAHDQARIVGIDDFQGTRRDQVVTRNPTTGVTYVGLDPIVGAPVLPLNWNLAATGDFDGDGKADILWRNLTSQKLVIWTMDGSTKTGTIVPNPSEAADGNWDVAGAADFNGDGHRDLLWYNQTSGYVVLWYMDAAVQRITGGFTSPASVGNNNWKVVAVGDFGRGPGAGVYGTPDIVWQNDSSKRIAVWHMDLAGQRTGGVFTAPDQLTQGFTPLDVVGPR